LRLRLDVTCELVDDLRAVGHPHDCGRADDDRGDDDGG
jgi:hypothetical protein